MKQGNSTIELSRSFQPEIRQERVERKSFKKIRYRRNCFLIKTILMVKEYMHENLNHTVKKHLAKKIKKYSHFQTMLPTIANRFHIKQYWHFHWITSKQYCLLVNSTTRFSRVYIKQYWNFQRVPSKLKYSKNFFHSTYHTIMALSESYYQTILTYSELILNSIHTFTVLLVNTFLRVWMDTH